MSGRTVFRGLVLAAVLCMLWTGAVCAQGAPNAGNNLAALQQAADKGDAQAQTLLGMMYARGNGVPQDLAKAAGLLQKAANQGHVPAEGLLGILYIGGEGVPKDVKKGCGLLHNAVTKGLKGAQDDYNRFCSK